MAIKDDIGWFKEQFAADVIPALAGTPLSFDLISAIAFQETGELWSKMRLHLPKAEVLRLCVGDTLDRKRTFPKNRADLESAENGQQMFDLAHELLIEMGDATGIEIYQRLGRQPDKFVHGYGIFQYDIQFFPEDQDFFLQKRWEKIENCVAKMMKELTQAVRQLGFRDRASLNDLESAFVAIVYNTGFGNFDASLGLQQGSSDGTNFYGENINHFMQIAHAIPTVTPPRPSLDAGGPQQPRRMTMPTARSLVDVTKAEFAAFGEIDEGKDPLRSHIADYYEAAGGSRHLDPTSNKNPWSAAFVSFCVKQSGATSSQFHFSMAHSVYVHDAIANQDQGRGVFRGHPITEYSPKLGDIIHHNRDGGDIDFETARRSDSYNSHSAIVVAFELHNGVQHAVTIGGNEFIAGGTGTVGKKRFPLDSNGRLDQAEIQVKLISVIENLLASGLAAPGRPLGPYVVNVRTDLKLRGGPSTTFPIISSLVNGTPLNVLGFSEAADGTWALVDLQNDGVKDGFVFAQFIDPVVS